jgi:hypothetical protein
MPRMSRITFIAALTTVIVSGFGLRASAFTAQAATQHQDASDASVAIATPAATPAATDAGSGCNITDVVTHLRTLIKYKEFDLSYNGVPADIRNNVPAALSLNIWFVDPKIVPTATGGQIGANARLARHDAAIMVQLLYAVDPCVGKLFLLINPAVVDAKYSSWISVSIFTQFLSPKLTSSAADIAKIDTTLMVSSQRNVPDVAAGAAPKDSCPWSVARTNLFSRQLDGTNPQNSFTLVTDDQGVTVNLQFGLPASMAASDALKTSWLITGTANALIEIKCLYPKPDQLFIQMVDEQGIIQVQAKLPREALAMDPMQIDKWSKLILILYLAQ